MANTATTSVVTDETISVYPNPVHDMLTIKTGFNLTGAKIKITNAAGRVVLTPKINEGRVNVAGLPAGIYWLSIMKDGKTNTISFIK